MALTPQAQKEVDQLLEQNLPLVSKWKAAAGASHDVGEQDGQGCVLIVAWRRFRLLEVGDAWH